MPETVPLRMSKATPEQVDRMRKFFRDLEDTLENARYDQEVGDWLRSNYKEVENDWERILFGYETLVENVCDPSLTYLDYKPEIKEALAIMEGSGGGEPDEGIVDAFIRDVGDRDSWTDRQNDWLASLGCFYLGWKAHAVKGSASPGESDVTPTKSY